MAKNTYKAEFKANNSSVKGNGYSDTNKNRLVSNIRTIAESNRTPNGDCSWVVYREDRRGCHVEYTIVAVGGMDINGHRFRCQ